MSYIIIHTTNEKTVRRRLVDVKKGHRKLFVLEISKNTYVMRNNGVALSYVAYLLNKYPNEVYVWIAERLTLRQFPRECVKAGKWLGRGRKLNNVPSYLGISKEELEKCKINYSASLSE
jgi:hypothetical protein